MGLLRSRVAQFHLLFAILALIVLISPAAEATAKGLKATAKSRNKAFTPTVSQYVNTFIGSGGYGFGIGSNPPGAQALFGLARVSPDTVGDFGIFAPFNHFGGYYYPDTTIRVLSHTHMVGSGVLDYGTIGFMPFVRYPSPLDVINYGYKSTFAHSNETASPGYYRVYLNDARAMVELTATTHVAYHRYTFDANAPKVVLVQASHVLALDAARSANVQINPASSEISGSVVDCGGMASRFGCYTAYFVATFNGLKFENYGTWINDSIRYSSNFAADNSTSASVNVGAYVGFGRSAPTAIEFTVALSSISVAQARANLQAEVGSQSFSQILQSTQTAWENALSIATIQSSSQDDLVKFYSALYRTLSSPTAFSEASGKYLGFDKQVHTLPGNMKNFYTDMSIWDVHRTQFPWLTLIRPDVMSDIINSLLLIYQQGGDLPRWPFANGYTSAMIGTHSIICIVDAYFKGVQSFNVSLAYQAMYQSATQQQQFAGRADLPDYINKGYVASDVSNVGCSETLEYAYDDWALGNLAQALGKTQDASTFLARSKNYKNVWYAPEAHMCARRSDGSFDCPSTWLNVFDSRYVEGDGEHWRWFVPHDPQGLVLLFGDGHALTVQLEEFMEYSKIDPYNILPNPYWWAGNEPDLFAPYFFDFVGRADLTQKYIRWNLYNKYLTTPDGLPGNDDYGTMSAWFIFGALGFYPQAGGTTYMLGSPLFDKITLQLPTNSLTIVSHNNGPNNFYIVNATINGKVVDLNWPMFDHTELVQSGGSFFEFWMSPNPPALTALKN